MKTALVKTVAGCFLLVMIACNNETSEAKTPEAAKPAPAATTPVKVEPKTEVSVGPDGAEVKTKDIKVKVNTRDTTKH